MRGFLFVLLILLLFSFVFSETYQLGYVYEGISPETCIPSSGIPECPSNIGCGSTNPADCVEPNFSYGGTTTYIGTYICGTQPQNCDGGSFSMINSDGYDMCNYTCQVPCTYSCNYSGPVCLNSLLNQVAESNCTAVGCPTNTYIPGTPKTAANCCSEIGTNADYSYDGYICCNNRGLSDKKSCTVDAGGGLTMPPFAGTPRSMCCPIQTNCGSKRYHPIGGVDEYRPACITGGGGGGGGGGNINIFPPFFCVDIFGSLMPCGFTLDQCSANLLCADNFIGGGCFSTADCQLGNICVNGVCVIGGGPGSGCETSEECSSGNICVNNRCECTVSCPSGNVCLNGSCCNPFDCSSAGVSCGIIDTGCGNAIDCGSCQVNQSCVNGSCVDDSCDAGSCGLIDTGSGILNCGDCAQNEFCNNGVCDPLIPPCDPVCVSPEVCFEGDCCVRESCGVDDCGFVSDGCGGTIYCPPCAPDKTCANNICIPTVCEPKTCIGLGAECGAVDDTCGNVLNCGFCVVGETCIGNICITDSGSKNSIVDANASFANDLLLGIKCLKDDPNSRISVFTMTSEVASFSGKLCSSKGNMVNLGSVDVPDRTILGIKITINEPCYICNRTIYLTKSGQVQDVRIPDNNLFVVLLLLCFVVLVAFRKNLIRKK